MPQASKKRILLVEDEADLAASLKYNLEKNGYEATTAHTGEEGLALARRRSFDMIILDLMLPGMDGYDVCRAVRALEGGTRLPILMLTARVEEADRIVGLEIGADDYMTKPFSMREILARVKAHIRRSERQIVAGELAYRDAQIELDLEGHVLRCDGREVRLTRMEFSLLSALVRSRGRVVTREHLLETVWGYHDYGASRTVDVHVRRLRRKLGPAGARIETVVGVGYRFREAVSSADF